MGASIRELRNEEGLQILTHNDRSNLQLGQYLLETSVLLPAFSREMSQQTRARVLDRNGYICQKGLHALSAEAQGCAHSNHGESRKT